MTVILDHLRYYRLPWNYADNGISWLEPTTKCNLRCEGCYRDVNGPGHKTLEEVRADLEVFRKLRKSDCMSIAGGDPLVYPEIVELVRIVKEMGWKPIVNTNGLALKEPLLRDLKKAGVFGFTFHIDTSQNRLDMPAKTEMELNPLRLRFAKMLTEVGGMCCSFNATISEKTLPEIPAMVNWAREHADIVHTMVFILYRSPEFGGDFDFYAQGKKIEIQDTYKETEWGGARPLKAGDVVEKIRDADPRYEPCAYLNGTANPNSFKWLLANRIVLGGETVGYASPRFMEVVQTSSHLFTGTYLAYAAPKSVARGKLAAFLGGLIDKRMRGCLRGMVGRFLSNPSNFFRQTGYIQSLMIIQPVDFMPDGRQDMCDGCPDVTVHEGKLVWSCRLEEVNSFGAFVQTVPKRT
jgi:MoaA/NifB/PqqE/SkfB family radical SAM enzyme